MGSKHAASGSISSAIAGPSTSNHIKRRSGGGQLHSSPPRQPQRLALNGGDSSSTLFGLGLEPQEDRGTSTRLPAILSSRSSSPSRSASFNSSSSSGAGGNEDWSNAAMPAHEAVERGSSTNQEQRNSHSLPSSSKNTPTKMRRSTSTALRNERDSSTSPWKPFEHSSWTPERRQLPSLFSEDALMMDSPHSHQGYTSPYRSHAGIPSLYRSSPSSSPSSSFYRSDSIPMVASTSNSSLYESTLSPSASFTSLSPSKSALDPRRNLDTTLSIAPSPPMASSSFQPHHLSSPNSLTNRTSPKSGPHRRDGSLSTSTCMPVSSSTSSFFAPARRVNSTDLAKELASSNSRAIPSFKSDQKRQARWRDFNWKTRKRSPSDDDDSVTGRQPLRETSRLALSIASICLGPFFPLVFPDQTITRPASLSKSSSGRNRHIHPNSKRRWQGRAIRLLLGLYLLYSVYLFTSRLLNVTASRSPNMAEQRNSKLVARQHEASSDYTQWQKARTKLLDVYNVAADAIGSTALRIGRQSSKEAAGDFGGDSNGANSLTNLMLLDRLPEVRRRWGDTSDTRTPALNPLSSFSTDYRFSKMFSKSDASVYEQIEPFLFEADSPGKGGDVTACLYFNDAWISTLPEFMERWRGPVSIVYELAENKTSAERSDLLKRLHDLRKCYPLIKKYADIHAVYNTPQIDLQARRVRERLILRPVASNLQLNLARFFAKTDIVWLVADARVLPAPNLRQKLNEMEEVRSYTMDYADAIIIPTFGATRLKTANSTDLPLLAGVREVLGIDDGQKHDGVSKEDFDKLSKAYVSAHFESIPLDLKDWPVDKATLLGLSSNDPPASVLPDHLQDATGPIFTLFDRRWAAGKGPTNFSKWKTAEYTPATANETEHGKTQLLVEPPSSDAGFYEVIDYDLHYAPSLVIGRDRQPWCTERFEYNRAACIYQMYLQGANKWVLPNSWAYTLEQTNKSAPKEAKNAADKLKSAIQVRLYTKFFSEACLHYGRAFLSSDLWDSERATHLRYSCAKVLNSYGIGLSPEEEAAYAEVEEKRKRAQKKKNRKKKQKQ